MEYGEKGVQVTISDGEGVVFAHYEITSKNAEETVRTLTGDYARLSDIVIDIVSCIRAELAIKEGD